MEEGLKDDEEGKKRRERNKGLLYLGREYNVTGQICKPSSSFLMDHLVSYKLYLYVHTIR